MTKSKNLSSKLIVIILIIITIARIMMISNLPLGIEMYRGNDQKLMLDLSMNLIKGEYLGEYNSSTLVKGIVYPLLMMICHFSQIPFYVFFTLIYIASVIILIYSLRKYFNIPCLVIMYLVLLFNPTSFAGQTFMEVYRNGLGMSTILLFIASLIYVYQNKDYRVKSLISTFCLGIVIALIVHTREDAIWMMPVLGIFFVVLLIKINSKIRFGSILLLSFIPLLAMNCSLQYLNMKNYNTPYINELKEGYYPKFLLDVLQIDVGERYSYYTLTEKNLWKAFEASETFSKFKNFFIKDIKMVRLDNASAMWSVRNSIYESMNFKDGQEADNFFKKMYEELEDAYDRGELVRDKRVLSIFLNRIDRRDYIPIIKTFFVSIWYSLTYQDLDFYYVPMTDDYQHISSLYNSTSISPFDYKLFESQFDFFKNIWKIYIIAIPILGIMAFIKFLVLWLRLIFKREQNVILFIATLIFVSYSTLIFGMSYTDVVSFETIMPFYLTVVYSLQVVFIAIMLLPGKDRLSWKR